MHYIPKYSRDRQNKRQSQNFVTVIDKEKFAKSLDENKLIVTNLRVDTLKKVKLTGNKTKMNIIEATKKAVDENKAIYRKSLPHIKFIPTNSKNAAFILFSDDNDSPAGRIWNPMAKDILSNDWEVLN
ncbi:Thoeris anti-defense Tad2 family protein [Lactococcus lactis]|uniref:Thoeris anti-defense 2-like domain-containing protein n=2 Tax=Lactococcus lactis TaxID=1358 RepID=A0AAW7J0V8_9LACT|nr:hypothetical protein [Lactococcus lactis]KST88043.1 putative phage protein [Lactococcus lactis subsp. lactis]MDM7547607.1 hypothetical protein [Lactococcus lactis]MDM7659951.1 hypothetical protein [Lactococcus lactis]MDX6023902.1 hypothetical protein [Lactococcus lactis subsp. lactis]PCS15391.1 hypothetical protein RU91_GL001192 [Lactococcus lactis subsp. lactis]